MSGRSDDFVTDGEMAQMRQAEIDHPATEHTNAGGWCKHCGCGNDALGHKHLPSCSRLAGTPVDPMHRLIIGPRKVDTACGISMVAYYPMSETGLPAGKGKRISCSNDIKTFITCERCGAVVGAST